MRFDAFGLCGLDRTGKRAGIELDRLWRGLRLLHQFLDPPAGFDAFRPGGKDIDRCVGGRIALLEKEPVALVLLSRATLQTGQHPSAVEFLPCQAELEGALAQVVVDIAHRRPDALVPDDHRTAAIFAFGDHALEVDIVEGMVLRLHRQPLVGRIERRTFRHRPAFQHAVDLKPQIVVVGGRMVFVHDEAVAAGGQISDRLRRLRKIRFLR